MALIRILVKGGVTGLCRKGCWVSYWSHSRRNGHFWPRYG